MNFKKAYQFFLLLLYLYSFGLYAAFDIEKSKVELGKLSCASLVKKISIFLHSEPRAVDQSLEAFLKAYPLQSQYIKGINTKFTGFDFVEKPTHQSRADLLVISTYEMSDGEKELLQKKYVNEFSENMISFTGTTHLHIRLNGYVYDFMNDVLAKDIYDLPYEIRYEPLIIFRESEFKRLSKFIKNSFVKTEETIGKMDISPPEQYNQSPSLTDNRPLVGMHNCTSWVCSSPIGDNGETLSELIGSKLEFGGVEKLMAWISQKSTRVRSPFSIYWTDKPLVEQIEELKKSKELDILNEKEDSYDEIFNYDIN